MQRKANNTLFYGSRGDEHHVDATVEYTPVFGQRSHWNFRREPYLFTSAKTYQCAITAGCWDIIITRIHFTVTFSTVISGKYKLFPI